MGNLRSWRQPRRRKASLYKKAEDVTGKHRPNPYPVPPVRIPPLVHEDQPTVWQVNDGHRPGENPTCRHSVGGIG